jgi:hypothetical protein
VAAELVKQYPELSPGIAVAAALLQPESAPDIAEGCVAMAPDYAIEIANAVSAKFPKKSLSVTNAIARVLPDEDYKLTVLMVEPNARILEVPSGTINFNLGATGNAVTFRTLEKISGQSGIIIVTKIGSAATGTEKQFTATQVENNKQEIVDTFPDFSLSTTTDSNGNTVSILRDPNSNVVMTDAEQDNVINNLTVAQQADLGFTTGSVTVTNGDGSTTVVTYLVDNTTGGTPSFSQANAKILQDALAANPGANTAITGISGLSVSADGNLLGANGKKIVSKVPVKIASSAGSDPTRDNNYTAP